jgi:predicted ATPase
VGRATDIADLLELATKSRLLTITGAGGVGKTRVAVELAREHLGMHTDGVWFIDLAPVTDAGLVDDAVLQALGVSRETALGPRAQLVAHLSSRNVLLVIDNCEHLIDACSSLIDGILRACPSVTVVATSREPIGIDGEVTRALRSLDTSESHALFVRRASLINDAIDLDDDARAAIDRIVERLDGIPLAIELAAGRSRILTPQQIAERLDDRFQLLTGGSRTALARQRTLEATVEWSYSLLDDDERTLLERASVFIGPFDLDAIEAVCGADALDALDRLVAKSMVTSTFADGGVRYRLLETIRHFARDKLVASGDAAEYRDQHARYFRTLVCTISDGFMDERENEAAAIITAVYANIRSALEWLLEHGTEDGLELASHLWLYWAVTGRPVEALEWVERFLDAAPGADPDIVARGHAAASHLNALQSGDPTQETRLHGEATVARMHERDGTPRWYEAWTLMQLVDADRYDNAKGIEGKRRAAVDVCRDVGNGFVLANAAQSGVGSRRPAPPRGRTRDDPRSR